MPKITPSTARLRAFQPAQPELRRTLHRSPIAQLAGRGRSSGNMCMSFADCCLQDNYKMCQIPNTLRFLTRNHDFRNSTTSSISRADKMPRRYHRIMRPYLLSAGYWPFSQCQSLPAPSPWRRRQSGGGPAKNGEAAGEGLHERRPEAVHRSCSAGWFHAAGCHLDRRCRRTGSLRPLPA
jgi:hypothetical protein